MNMVVRGAVVERSTSVIILSQIYYNLQRRNTIAWGTTASHSTRPHLIKIRDKFGVTCIPAPI
ncbi:hypothetical protein AG1IA_05732 [Rhizoctonia solani AG-1 IA]|uniref:Uncharacterized protein n=1 Tax=Thanatephorus cucumeris (strain AG1-IA) TaxID=983506 RepID=L8WQ13_THACA|nr:hypothetical protein AG1IA_05732 [Rhizoctonia solani AG-1 IA]